MKRLLPSVCAVVSLIGDGTLAERIPPYGLKHGQARDYFAHDD